MRAQVRLVLLLCSAIAPFASAEELPAVTPYRSTVSNPAALSQPGWREVEAGWNSSKASDNSSRGNLPYVLKFAFTDNMGVLLGAMRTSIRWVQRESRCAGRAIPCCC